MIVDQCYKFGKRLIFLKHFCLEYNLFLQYFGELVFQTSNLSHFKSNQTW